MGLIIALFVILLMLFVRFVAVPFCLQVVLGIFGVHVGFIPCLALVVVITVLFGLARGGE